MNKLKKYRLVELLCLGLLIALASPVQGQPAGQTPHVRSLSDVETIIMPPVDVKTLLAEDEARFEAGLPVLRFAQAIPVRYTPETAGTWQSLDAERLLWRLHIISHGALSLNLGFARYRMPSGGQLYLYTPDYKEVIGPFTEADNEEHGQLWTPILLGDEIIVEVSLPAAVRPKLELELTSVNHGYVPFGLPRTPQSGACNVDVVCGAADGYPQVDAWRDPIRAVGAYSVGGVDYCSGALINNTAQDLTPYFLTADHCGVSSGNAASVVVYWNYQNSWCRPPGGAASGQPGDGSRAQFNSGAIFRADYSPSDFTLIEMDDPINSDYNLHWAGWDRRDQATSSAVAIHHPGVEEKRISFENDPTSVAAYLGNPGSGTDHIRIADWDLGTTEGGSSGSPLFSPEQHIIGQLHGGYAACGNDDPDWYGRLFVSWTGGGAASSRLSDWLDPLGTGALVLDGRDEVEDPFLLDITPQTQSVCAPDDAVYNVAVTQEQAGYGDPVTLSSEGHPAGTTVGFSVNPVTPPGASVLTLGNTGAAAPGSYLIDVVGIAPTATVTSALELLLFSGPPGQPALLSPANGATDVSTQPTFRWTTAPQSASYLLEVATDIGLANVVYTANVEGTEHTAVVPFSTDTRYYWRMLPNNACGLGAFSATFSFRTANVRCTKYDSTDVPLPIPEEGGTSGPTTSTLNVAAGGTILDVNVLGLTGTHTWMNDLDFALDSPQSTEVQLMARSCSSTHNFDLNLDDEAAPGPWPCPPTDGGTYQPTGSLADLNGEDSTGTWTLTIVDNANWDSGQLNSWSLEICTAGQSTVHFFYLPVVYRGY